MSTYRRYQEARDAAWRALLDAGVRALPVDTAAVAKRMGMEIFSFQEAQREPRLSALLRRAGNSRCVSLRIRGKWLIFLSKMNDAQERFSLAHEMGHCLLRHKTYVLSPGVRAFQGRENAGDLLEDPRELDDYAADIFAVRLLAPACVLHALGMDTPGKIQALCGLPPQAAALRAERMALLDARNAFFAHPLEARVRDQFLPFIRARIPQGPVFEARTALPQAEAASAQVEAPPPQVEATPPRARLLLPAALPAKTPPGAKAGPSRNRPFRPARNQRRISMAAGIVLLGVMMLLWLAFGR